MVRLLWSCGHVGMRGYLMKQQHRPCPCACTPHPGSTALLQPTGPGLSVTTARCGRGTEALARGLWLDFGDDELNINPPTPCQIGKRPPAPKPKRESAGHQGVAGGGYALAEFRGFGRESPGSIALCLASRGSGLDQNRPWLGLVGFGRVPSGTVVFFSGRSTLPRKWGANTDKTDFIRV